MFVDIKYSQLLRSLFQEFCHITSIYSCSWQVYSLMSLLADTMMWSVLYLMHFPTCWRRFTGWKLN